MKLSFGKLFRITSASALITGLLLTSASAATTFSDRTLFEPTLNTSVTDDYSNAGYGTPLSILSDANMSAVLGETTYSSTGFTNHNLIADHGLNNTYCAGCNGSFNLGFASTSVGTSDGVYGVGFDYNNGSNPTYTAFVTFGDGSTENYALPTTSNSFFGITSDLLIASMHLGLINGGVSTSGYFYMDNLTIGSVSAVPLPAGLPLYGAGIALLGLVGWHRKRKQSIETA